MDPVSSSIPVSSHTVLASVILINNAVLSLYKNIRVVFRRDSLAAERDFRRGRIDTTPIFVGMNT